MKVESEEKEDKTRLVVIDSIAALISAHFTTQLKSLAMLVYIYPFIFFLKIKNKILVIFWISSTYNNLPKLGLGFSSFLFFTFSLFKGVLKILVY